MRILDSKDFFDLTEHNFIQKIVFIILFLLGSIGSFYLILPLLEDFFQNYLAGTVVHTGESVYYLLDSKNDPRETDYLLSWAIDIYKNSPQEGRYWLNPVLALVVPCSFIGIFFAFIFSSLLPNSIGLIHQKIEREIASIIDKITLQVFGIHSTNERNKIQTMLVNADLRDLHDFEKQWRMPITDIISIRNALLWQTSNFPKSIKYFLNALSFYMRFYITAKYSNFILGLVYFGAAVLIFIIGLRGLKFIPSQEPSLVFFSLGLEFCLLVVYALTLMYAKEDSQSEHSDNNRTEDKLLLSREFASGKETEELLKMFIINQDNQNVKEKGD